MAYEKQRNALWRFRKKVNTIIVTSVKKSVAAQRAAMFRDPDIQN